MDNSKKEPMFQHDMGLHLGYINDHSDVDTGLYPELRYRIRHDWWFDIEAGLRWGPPKAGDLVRYHLMFSIHFPIPTTRTFALQFGWMHSSYMDIKRGENLLLFLNHIDTKYFEFRGGLGIRFPLTTESSYLNPFFFATEYVETTLLFDFRLKLEFTFPKIGGSVLQVGVGMMDFLPTDILMSNTVGYQFFARWRHPRFGFWELGAGLMSYSFLDLTGFYGRFFVNLSYTYRFGR